jgi:hypothetical protein
MSFPGHWGALVTFAHLCFSSNQKEVTNAPQWPGKDIQVYGNENEINMDETKDDYNVNSTNNFNAAKNNQIVPYDQNYFVSSITESDWSSPLYSGHGSRFHIKDSWIMNQLSEPDESFRDYLPRSKRFYLNKRKCNKACRIITKFVGGIVAFPFALLIFFPDLTFFVLYFIFAYTPFIPQTKDFRTARDWFLALSITAFVYRIVRCFWKTADAKWEKKRHKRVAKYGFNF